MNRKKIALCLASVLTTTTVGLYYFNVNNTKIIYAQEPVTIQARVIDRNSPNRGSETDRNIEVKPIVQELPTYNIPLPKEFLQYIYDLCKEYNVPYELALAVMKTESQFKVDAYNKNNNGTSDVGLFQINTINFKWLSKDLQIYDFWEAYNNARAGIYILSVSLKESTSESQALITYNSGRDNAIKLANRGVHSNTYSDRVLDNKKNLIEK